MKKPNRLQMAAVIVQALYNMKEPPTPDHAVSWKRAVKMGRGDRRLTSQANREHLEHQYELAVKVLAQREAK